MYWHVQKLVKIGHVSVSEICVRTNSHAHCSHIRRPLYDAINQQRLEARLSANVFGLVCIYSTYSSNLQQHWLLSTDVYDALFLSSNTVE